MFDLGKTERFKAIDEFELNNRQYHLYFNLIINNILLYEKQTELKLSQAVKLFNKRIII